MGRSARRGAALAGRAKPRAGRRLARVPARFPGYGAVYAEYASFLDAQNQSGAVSDWRGLSAELDAGTIFSLGDQGFTRLAVFGGGGLVLLLICLYCCNSCCF